MKEIVLLIIFNIIKIINTLIPKSNKKIIFISRPDFSDNTYYMYKFLKSINFEKECSWLIYDLKIFNILIEKGHTNIYYLKSFWGVWQYLRSKYIITSSSSLWQIKSPLQKQYDLWHGIPLKNVLCMGEKGVKAKRQAGNITKRFATSSLVKSQLAASFDFNAIKIEVTGQPRTDALFSSTKYLSEILNISIKDYKKVVMYMPTYRHGYRNKEEGNKFKSNNVFRMENYNHNDFLKFLKKEKILMLLKLHPYEEDLYANEYLGENMKWITNDILIENGINTYDLLSEIDTLITDYSSIFFDFLLLDRKIIFLPIDLEYYQLNRGFELEPYDFWAPGEKIYEQVTFQKSLTSPDSNKDKEHRKMVRDIMFTYQDGNSSQRVFEVLSKDMGEERIV